MQLLASAFRLVADLCVASAIFAGLLAALPCLTLFSAALRHFILSSSRKRRKSWGDGRGEEDGRQDAGETMPVDLVLFSLKGTLLWLLLLHADALLGIPAAAWACAFVLEYAYQLRDPSLKLLLEPMPKLLDLAFLLGVAPLLSATAGGIHGTTAAWHAYLSATFFWRRTDADAPTAIAMTLIWYYFAWLVGIFSDVLVPPAVHVADLLLLLGATAVMLLIKKTSTRATLTLIALVLSSEFRRRTWALAASAGAALHPALARLTLVGTALPAGLK
jgi:hypothetical protein